MVGIFIIVLIVLILLIIIIIYNIGNKNSFTLNESDISVNSINLNLENNLRNLKPIDKNFFSNYKEIELNYLISGERIQRLSDLCIFDKNYINKYPVEKYCNDIIYLNVHIPDIDIKKIKKSKVFFVNTDYLQYFYKQIEPIIDNKFILITHNSDINPDLKVYPYKNIINSNKLIKWFGENLPVTSKSKCIPIGLENSVHKRVNMNNILKYRNTDKKFLLYFNFNENTNPIRKKIKKLLLNNNFTFNKNLKWNDYIKELCKYKFCISPPGNGIDCHRHWECIYVGTIPIILKDNNVIYDNFKDLPILFVNNYNQINKNFLEIKYNEMKNKYYNLEKTKLRYWENEINILIRK